MHAPATLERLADTGDEQREMLPERTIRELRHFDYDGKPTMTIRHYQPERPHGGRGYGHEPRYQIVLGDGNRIDFDAHTGKMLLADLQHLFPEDKTVYAVTA